MVDQILQDHQIDTAEVSIAVVSDNRIRTLNRQYLQHDWETDVLSFNLGSDSGDLQLVGEVVVSADTALRCAGEHRVDPFDELALYVIHGILHLVGYGDKAEDARQRMRQAEQKYASKFGLKYCHPDQDATPDGGAG